MGAERNTSAGILLARRLADSLAARAASRTGALSTAASITVIFEEADGASASVSTPGTRTRTATATWIPIITIPTMLRQPLLRLAIPTEATTAPTANGFPIRTARFRRRRLRLRTDTDGASLKTAVASQRLPLAATVAAGVAFDYRFDQFQAELGRKRRSRRLLTTRPHRGWNSIAVAIGVSLE